MPEIEYDYLGTGNPRIRTQAAGVAPPSAVATSPVSATAPSGFPMPNMQSLMKWAAQQRAAREEADRSRRMGLEDTSPAREAEDAAFARNLALRNQEMREQAYRDERADAEQQDPYFVKMVNSPGTIGGYRPAQPWEAGAVAGGFMPKGRRAPSPTYGRTGGYLEDAVSRRRATL